MRQFFRYARGFLGGGIAPGLILAVATLLGACSGVESRIRRNPEAFTRLSAADRALVSEEKIRAGMTKSAVYLAWGNPDQRVVGARDGKEFEEWIYLIYAGYPVTRYELSPVCYGDRRYFPAFSHTDFETVVYPDKSVVFDAGRVSAWRRFVPR